MLKLFLTSMLLSVSLSANTPQEVLYGNYIDCYYEIERVTSFLPLKYKVIPFSPKKITPLYEKFNVKKSLNTDPKYKFYIFSSDGFYGVIPNGIEKQYCTTCKQETGSSCAYDFEVTTEKENYILCYEKTWSSEKSTFEENVMAGYCSDYKTEANNLIMLGSEIMPNIGSEQLDSLTAFSEVLFPLLQKNFADLAHKYIWTPAPTYNFCDYPITIDDIDPNTRSETQIKARMGDIKEIINNSSCFQACKKISKNIISMDVLNTEN
jgi:hypothetical protein